MHRPRLILSMLAIAGILAPGAAMAAPTTPLPELFAAFKAICLANVDNSPAQIATAKAAPYKFMDVQTDPDGTKVLSDGRYVLWVLEDGKTHYCMISSNVEKSVRQDDGVGLMKPMFGEPANTEDGVTMWAGSKNGRPAFYAFMLRTEEGQDNPTASFASGLE